MRGHDGPWSRDRPRDSTPPRPIPTLNPPGFAAAPPQTDSIAPPGHATSVIPPAAPKLCHSAAPLQPYRPAAPLPCHPVAPLLCRSTQFSAILALSGTTIRHCRLFAFLTCCQNGYFPTILQWPVSQRASPPPPCLPLNAKNHRNRVERHGFLPFNKRQPIDTHRVADPSRIHPRSPCWTL